MAGKIKDVTGERFGYLVAIKRLEEKHKKHGYKWFCQCDCGNTKEAFLTYLTSGNTTSCGCLLKEINKNRTVEYSEMVKRFCAVHNNKYTYPIENESSYVNQTSRITVCCHEHGKFRIEAHNHLNGSECPKCITQRLIDENVYVGTYSYEMLMSNPEIANTKGLIYYLKIGEYFKIGITRVSLENRVAKLKCTSNLSVEVLDSKEMTMIEAYSLEQEVIKKNNRVRVYTDWSTELFSENVFDEDYKIKSH